MPPVAEFTTVPGRGSTRWRPRRLLLGNRALMEAAAWT